MMIFTWTALIILLIIIFVKGDDPSKDDAKGSCCGHIKEDKPAPQIAPKID
jgi:hypothetical protein